MVRQGMLEMAAGNCFSRYEYVGRRQRQQEAASAGIRG